jgi:hypothetical protein
VALADEGKFNEASQILEQAVSEINQSEVAQDETLKDESAALSREADALKATSDGNDTYRQQRKMMQSQAIYTMTSRHNETVILRKRTDSPTEAPIPNDLESTEANLHNLNVNLPAAQINSETPKFARYGDHDYPLTADEIHIGRAVENTIIVNDKGVSRYHCVIRREGEKLWLEDTGSTNGTLVNSVMLRARYHLHNGDVAQIGEARVLFHNGGVTGKETKKLS